MHASLPFDEAAAPSLVSTGELPQIEQVIAVVTEAYDCYRSIDDGTVADYIPALAGASAELFGICVAGARGRFFEIGDAEVAFSIQSVSNHSSLRWSARRSGMTRRGIGWASTAPDSRSTR